MHPRNWTIKTFLRNPTYRIIMLAFLLLQCFTLLWLHSSFGTKSDYDVIVDELRSFSEYVPVSYRTRGLDYFEVEKFLMDLKEFLKQRTPEKAPNVDLKELHEHVQFDKRVCPEEIKNKTYPDYHTRSNSSKCNGFPPLESLVTILINYVHETDSSMPGLIIVLRGIRNNYKKVPILIFILESIRSSTFDLILFKYDADVAMFHKIENEGKLLNKVANKIKTPYVLIARNLIHFSWFSPLERSLRVLTETGGVKVVAGSFRNETGHWKVGCYQRQAKLYALKYVEGYHWSNKECMYCDHVSGSFITTVEAIKNRPFDENLPSELAYADWFMEMRLDGHKFMACPDVLYFQSSTDILEANLDSKALIPLAAKWKFDLLIFPGRRFLYSCSDISVDCYSIDDNVIRKFARPHCCMRLLADGMEEWHNLCVKNNILTELDTGFALGAVKTNGMTLWDSGGDIIYKKSHKYSIFSMLGKLDSKKIYFPLWSVFSQRGFYAGGVKVEMYSELNTTSELYLPKELRKIPTLMKFLGKWVFGPANPGLYSRNRYGYNYLKHSQGSWIKHMNSSFDRHEITKFKDCKNPRHHSCLSKFSVDGNLQFQRD